MDSHRSQREIEAAVERVERLLARDGITTAFQPIVDMLDGGVAAYEGLTRLDKDSGFSGPEELFRSAVGTSVLWDLEGVCRRSLLDDASSMPVRARIFLNVTPQIFSDERFLDTLREELSERSIEASRVVVEITELPDQSEDELLALCVEKSREMGVGIAVDDVGAGTSGLHRVMQLRPSWLKLDRAFVAGIDTDPFKQNLVQFFVHFARLSSVKVIAEGVETKEELQRLSSIGVRYAQGYYLAKPAEPGVAFAPSSLDQIRGRWSVCTGTTSVRTSTPLSHLARGAETVDGGTSVADVARRMLSDAGCPGVVVMDGRRFHAWCSRGRVLELGQGPGALERIADAVGQSGHMIDQSATVQVGLRQLATRDDTHIADPLVLMAEGRVSGVVRVQDLVQAAVYESSVVQTWRVTPTGLPSRVETDQRLLRLLAGGAEERGAAIAFVDIRCFSDFNAAFGYGHGDLLISQVSELLLETFEADTAHEFIGHIGEDRFVVVGEESSITDRLGSMLERFDTQDRRPLGAPDGKPCPPVYLRVLVIPHAFESLRDLREISVVEQQMRQRARVREAQANRPGSMLLRDERTKPAGASALRDLRSEAA